ncbi:MAG: exopolysaccharide biosynthesis polyprenyl glycosylphosphotransferase [Caulobacterales bacterium]|nr:exopolysaccharide biosynthesis polyprenyl glycosylphosphotransferase [Caulobacterales bacterium]
MSTPARAIRSDDLARTQGLDAAGLQALAAAAVATQDGRNRRGPFRPEKLVTSRTRQAERLSSFYFRGIDSAGLIGLTLAIGWLSGTSVMALPFASVLPLGVALAVALAGLRAMRLYGFGRGERLDVHLTKVAAAIASGGLLGSVIAVLTGQSSYLTSLLEWSLAAMLVAGVMHAVWWGIVNQWRAEGRLTPSIVIVGATKHAERLIADALRRRDINVLGIFDDRLARVPDAVVGVPVLGDLNALVGHRLTPYLDHIVIAVDPAARERVSQITQRLSALPNAVSLVVDQDGDAERDASLARLARSPLSSIEGTRDPDKTAFAKRLQDLIIGGIMLIGLAPLLALIALGIKLDSPGPVFFRQRRHGFNHEEIRVWKFRTMRHEAADATASRQVTADDDRITRFGRFLRKTSLDELPQLINVIQGEMSLVGPRPHAIGMKTGETESARLVAEYAHRHRIKPGMTGWAAIKGSRGPLHSAADVKRRVQLDIDYIERQSFWLDLWIILVTAPVLLGDRSSVR